MRVDKAAATGRYKVIAACCLAAMGSVVPGLYFLARGYTLVWRDTAKLFQPLRSLITVSLWNFQLPLWNPHEALGIPLFAQMMHGVLHPVSVLTSFLLPHSGLDVSILIHTALAAAGCTLLARVLGLSAGASAVAGLAYGLSGYLLGMGSIIQYLYGAASAPWAVAGLRAAGEGRRFGMVFAAVAVSVIFLAGDPQWAIIAILLGLALALEGGGKRGGARGVAAVVVGALIAAVQLIPTFAYMHQTSRGIELDMLDRLQWALSPWRLMEFVDPGLFGSPGTGLERWPVHIWLGGFIRSGFEMPFAPSVYVGAATMALAAAGVLRSRVTCILAVSSLVILWIALGSSLGAEQIMHYIPVWGKFRYAEKMVGPLTLCLSILAAFGAERLSERPSRILAVVSGSLGITSLLAALLLSVWQGFEGLSADPVAREAAPLALHNLALGLIHAGVALTALGALVAAAIKWPQLRSGFTMAAACLVFFQLSIAAPFAMHAGLRHMREDSYLLQIRSPGEPARIATPLEKNYLYPEGLNQFDAQIGAQSHLGVPCYNVPSGIDQLDTYTGLRPRRFELLLNNLSERFGVRSVIALRRYAISHMLIKNPYFPDELEVARAASEGGAMVLENREWGFKGWSVPHRPWALFADKVTAAHGEKEAMDALITAIGRGDATVVLEDAPKPIGLAPGKVLAIERGNNSLRIDAVSGGNGVLVINDSFWPGWRATIDGREVPIWRADFLVRAVPWPAGRHLLEMRYEPEEVTIGWLISGAGMIALFAMLVLEWRKRLVHS
jgi:hypothetical protein